MFKSVFAKYIVAFMSIILVSFVVIIFIVASIIGSYSETAKEEIVESVALSSADYLEEALLPGESLSSLIDRDAKELEMMLTVAAAPAEDITVLLTDRSGSILLAVGSDRDQITAGEGIPTSLMAEIQSGAILDRNEALHTVFEKPHFVYGVPVYNEGESVCATVFVCASSGLFSNLMEVIVSTIVVTSLMVLLAALIAVYLITERVIGPLKDISRAARSFADGKFDVRVPVRGRDEVAEVAVAFNRMAESMNNYDTMRNTFMSNVSHDLRTPMTSIAGFIDGILDGVIPPERHEYYLQLVSSEVKRLSRLVSTLLDLSRIQAGERKFTKTPFDICEMGRQILISFEQKINDKRLDVDFDCDEDRMQVVADRDAIYQIFYNLCDNAVKFAAEGGAFRISIRKQKFRKIVISVYNEGQGISDADLPHVFDRFYKSDKSRGLNKTGVGLGLFIAKTIVEAHEERIWVESDYGRNCCFNFTLTGE